MTAWVACRSTARMRPAARQVPGDQDGPQGEAPVLATCAGEQLGHLRIEGGDVVGFSARDQITIDNNLLIDPVSSRVLEIGFQRWPGGHAPPSRGTCLDDGPRPVADRCHWLAGIEEGLHERDCLGVHPEEIGVHHTARQEQRVVVLRLRLIERLIHVQFITPLRELPGSNTGVFGRDDLRHRASRIECLTGFGQFDLLETLCDENSNFQSCETWVSHGCSSNTKIVFAELAQAARLTLPCGSITNFLGEPSWNTL